MKKLLLLFAVLPFIASGQYYISTVAPIYIPWGVAIDASGNLYVSDDSLSVIRKISPSGSISTFAGTGTAGFSGDGGPATAAQLNKPYQMAFDASGNLYVADGLNNRVRMISPSGIITTVAGNGTPTASPDGTPATSSGLISPTCVRVSPAGELYISESFGHRIRKVSATGAIYTAVGTGVADNTGDGGPATAAAIYYPRSMTFDAAGNLYLTSNTNSVRKVDATGVISTFAGSSAWGYSGDGGPATSALFFGITSMVSDAAGNIYISDAYNSRIRKVTGGLVSTFAGNGIYDCTGDGGSPLDACIRFVNDIVCDAAGNFYLADPECGEIRRISTTPPSSVAVHNAPSISLFPNPARGSVSISCPLPENYSIAIFNALGATVLTQKLQPGTQAIDVAALPAGIYTVKASFRDHEYVTSMVRD